MKTLTDMYQDHIGKLSDKWEFYLREYERVLKDYRKRNISLLEIGIQNGGSLEIWERFFSNAKIIIGCDINKKCRELTYNKENIFIVIGDSNESEVKNEILKIESEFDIIIDDGSHMSSDIIRGFFNYFPLLKKDGIFIVEDLHCSYWKEFEGGLYDSTSSISFFKALVDIVNHEHWGINKKQTEFLIEFSKKYQVNLDIEVLMQIESIEFLNSMCIIRKQQSNKNKLGHRVRSGQEAIVDETVKNLPDEYIYLSQDNNIFSMKSYDQQILELQSKIKQQRENINQQILELQSKIKQQRENINQQIFTIKQLSSEKVKLNETLLKNEEIINDKERHIQNIEAMLSKITNDFYSIQNATIWKLTAPIRKLLDILKIPLRKIKNLHSKIRMLGGYQLVGKKLLSQIKKSGVIDGLKFAYSKAKAMPIQTISNQSVNELSFFYASNQQAYQKWIQQNDMLTDEKIITINKIIKEFTLKPTISILMPVYNVDIKWLEEAIQSVQNQIYPHWELCIADDASSHSDIKTILQRYSKQDSRIKVVFREKNGHISECSNSALEIVSGEWVALMDHDDLLPINALFEVTKIINLNPNTLLIYSDEDKIKKKNIRFSPHFKSDFNLDLLYSQNYISHLGVYKTDIARQIDGFRKGFEGSQDYDFLLRYLLHIDYTTIVHIPKILYHWRAIEGSTALSACEKSYTTEAGIKALQDYFVALQKNVTVTQGQFANQYRIRWGLADEPLVSLIIPTYNGYEITKQAIDSILSKTTYENYEILLVDNNSDDKKSLDYFSELKHHPKIKVLKYPYSFNYSAINNFAVLQAKGELIALINNDIEVINNDWLTEMVSQAMRPDIGCVGAMLYYPNDTIQHAGVIIGLGGVAGHSHKYYPRGDPGYFFRLCLVQNYQAVTAACLLVRKNVFEEVGGLNEKDLTVAFNDVDFCLKVQQAGYRNLWTPYAELYHHESISRGHEDSPEKIARFNKEMQYMINTWSTNKESDKYFNINLDNGREDFSISLTGKNTNE